MGKIFCKLGFHKFTWTEATRDWFFTGQKNGFIGSECARCGKQDEKL